MTPIMSNEELQARIASLTAALEKANSTLFAKMDELSLVRRVGDAISVLTSGPELCKELVHAVSETITCSHAAIYSGPVGSPFHLQALSQVFGPSISFPETITNSRVARMISNFQTLIRINDTQLASPVDSDWPFPPNLRSWFFVPLVEGRNLRGVLCLADEQPNTFSEETERTMMIVVPQVASALAKIGLYEGVRSSEIKYRTLVESMHDVVFICDPDWKIDNVNAASITVFGQSIAGRTLTDLFDSAAAAQQFLETVQSKGFIQNFEAEMKSNRQLSPTVLLSCVRQENGYTGVIKDVTERARLVEQIVRAQKMESVGTLAAGVAHDFNNILGIIMPNAELIKLRTPSEPAILKHADVIIAASKRANQLTKQLLSLARKEPRQVRTINLNESIRTTCGLFEQTIGKRISVKLEFESDPVYIRADDSQIEQILLNLAINARDAMPDGGSLQFITKLDGSQISLRVIDSGTGIGKEILPNIFDPFFTTKDKSKGTGLGLSVVYSLVKQIGGTIDVRSELGSGTEFILAIPAHFEAPELPIPNLADPAGGNERILVVDDEPEMRNLLETVLKGIGYQVVSAANGMEAVERITKDYQLVIMDMVMPIMDGLTAVHAIRQKLPQMKILVASGYTTAENFPTLRKMNVEGFVQKPFELHKLAHLIRDVLDGAAA
ncbi:MAG TPA: ATP-binding protein [Terriglobia bacterium]|nr:ATP-binding protein [Terriglobia bacterium]